VAGTICRHLSREPVGSGRFVRDPISHPVRNPLKFLERVEHQSRLFRYFR